MPEFNLEADPASVFFDNKEQSDLFLNYIEKTTVDFIREDWSRKKKKQTLKEVCNIEKQGNTFIIPDALFAPGIILKFMEVTKILEVGKEIYEKHFSDDYKLDPKSPTIFLGRQAKASIPKEIFKKMQHWNTNVEVKTKELIQIAEKYHKLLSAEYKKNNLSEKLDSNIKYTPEEDKLDSRYRAISSFCRIVKEQKYLSIENLQQASNMLKICIENQPSSKYQSSKDELFLLRQFKRILKLLNVTVYFKEQNLREKLETKINTISKTNSAPNP